MKFATLLYTVLFAIGIAAVVAVPVALVRGGSTGLPIWTASVTPGPLSAAHEFLSGECEACHVPMRGVTAATCLTCHVTAAPNLMTRPSTTFHQTVGECAGCHLEHQGRARRPIAMDHTVLAAGAHAEEGTRHILARLEALLDRSASDLRGATPAAPPGASGGLDCAGCHANRDPHRTLFGRDCQSCHITSAWTVAAYRHPSPGSRDCVQCHQAPPSHYMMHFEMMDRTIARQEHARVDQCFLCHQTDAWNNIRGVGWFKHH